MTDKQKLELAEQVLRIVNSGQEARCYIPPVQPPPGQTPKVVVEAIPSHRA